MQAPMFFRHCAVIFAGTLRRNTNHFDSASLAVTSTSVAPLKYG